MVYEELAPTDTSVQDGDAQAQREKNTTCEGILVRRGQIWENLDTRQSERHVAIESVADGEAQVRDHYGTKRSSLSISLMHRHATGWRLVEPGELKYGAPKAGESRCRSRANGTSRTTSSPNAGHTVSCV
ncbi:hypothetical protein [Kitasatospora sp. NPDC098663]|uniref:hypothetical protein n=1 Tax=Kitasatospora sp. NPDC098663 TaxID=3364096 RepID=UPI0037F63ABF